MSGEELSLIQIDKLRYRPTRDAQEFLDKLRGALLPAEKFHGARLAIARSLVEPGEVAPLPKGTDWGSSIEGMHLFGDDTSVWACLLVQASGQRVSNVEQFRGLVEAHWSRGAQLLQADHDAVGRTDVDFAVRIASTAGIQSGGSRAAVGGGIEGTAERILVRLGEVGIDQRANVPIDVALNAPGVSPHIALMGKTRTGKTRTGLVMAERIARDARLPILLIDPKGEFIKDGAFSRKSEWGGQTIGDRFPGIEPLDVPVRPVPLDFLAVPPNAKDAVIAQAAIAFRDSFEKCIRAKGDVALDNLRQAVEFLLQQRALVGDLSRRPQAAVSLDKIREAMRLSNEEHERKKDSIEAKLNELTALKLFEPSLAPAEFFRRRWAIGLGSATEESRRLVMFLVLDALASHLLSLEDSATDSGGYRSLRHLLVIDEAKEILSYRHGALSNLVRKSAAKGGVVMLLSQSPSDFDQEADDFLEQMGTVAVFASSAKSVKNLRAALGRKVDPEDFNDKELPRGVALAKVPGKDPMRVIAWK